MSVRRSSDGRSAGRRRLAPKELGPHRSVRGIVGAGVVGAIVVGAIGLVHALVIAPRYHVGSFDDDASYVLAARALAVGHGITSRAAGGYPLVGVYPPGYPALLSPLAAIWPSSVFTFRVVSLLLFVSIFPLTWAYLRRRRIAQPLRLAILALLALNPVLGTYATMVMSETAFVVVLLLMLLALDRWQLDRRTITWAGAGSVLSAAALLWLKEAGVGVVIGVVLWLALRRLFRKAFVAAAVSVVLLMPLMIMRSLAGADLIGSRYSGDLGGVFKGGLVSRVVHVVPHAAWTYVTEAVPRTIVPISNGFLPSDGPVGGIMLVLTWTAAPLVVLGFVVWCRRHADAACLAVPVYLAETLIYPYTNERRVVLVLPVILAWYAFGAASAFAAIRSVAGRVGGRIAPRLGVVLPVMTSLLLLVALAGQFTRDYLYFEGADSSSPGGSPYMAVLRQLGTAQDVVETDYLWTTALYSGHRTANGAYLAGCDPGPVADAVHADRAGYLLTASLNGSGPVDGGCLLPVAASLPQAVRLYRTSRDQASVFQFVGPGTAHPDLGDRVATATVDGGGAPVSQPDEQPQLVGDPAGRYWSLPANQGTAKLTWSWNDPVEISQISLGAASGIDSSTASVQVSARSPDGGWRVLAAAPGPVGAGRRTAFLLVRLPRPEVVTALRVSVGVNMVNGVNGVGPESVAVHDFHALGPNP
ncbi:MAG: hypothetical protein QOE57_1443 [Acidimicrobiaceae bacterium]|nr:hypothetical protein [Acidimicrobiaceae bacterium]